MYLAGINFSVFKRLVMFFLLITCKLKDIERRTNFSGHLLYRLDTLMLNSLNKVPANNSSLKVYEINDLENEKHRCAHHQCMLCTYPEVWLVTPLLQV